MKSTVFLYSRFVLIALMASISQLFLLESARAQESIQTGSDLSGKGNPIETKPFVPGSDPVIADEEPGRQPENEVRCLALNIYFEARSEPELGQRAVGHVVMNRVSHPGYPSSVCEVVQQGGEQKLHRCQFSWWCDGKSDEPADRKAWTRSVKLARQIYSGVLKDITDGALWYHATYVKPYWSKILLQGDRIGQHIFYIENRLPKLVM